MAAPGNKGLVMAVAVTAHFSAVLNAAVCGIAAGEMAIRDGEGVVIPLQLGVIPAVKCESRQKEAKIIGTGEGNLHA